MITDTHLRILQLVNRLHYTTAEQVQRRYYSRGSKSTVQSHLKDMVELEYLHRIEIRSWPRGGGSYPYFYTTGRRGRAVLRDLGDEVREHEKPGRADQLSGLFLSHTIKVNDILVSAELLEESSEEITINDYMHERVLRRRFRGAIPDLYVDIAAGGYRYPLLFELDTGTIDGTRMRDKVGNLVRFYQGPFRRHFGLDAATIAVVCPDHSRARSVSEWIAREAGKYAHIFLVSSTTPTNHLLLFGHESWLSPATGERLPLIEI